MPESLDSGILFLGYGTLTSKKKQLKLYYFQKKELIQ